MPCQTYRDLGYCGLCYSNRRGRSNYKGHSGYRQFPRAPEEIAMRFVKPAASADAEPVKDPAVTGCPFPSEYPALWEYLTASRWEDGRPRQTATLMVCVEDGRFKGCVNDRANGRSVWVSAGSFTGLLGAVEAVLQSGQAEWRRNQWSKGKGR